MGLWQVLTGEWPEFRFEYVRGQLLLDGQSLPARWEWDFGGDSWRDSGGVLRVYQGFSGDLLFYFWRRRQVLADGRVIRQDFGLYLSTELPSGFVAADILAYLEDFGAV